jgi:hypothetical protein
MVLAKNCVKLKNEKWKIVDQHKKKKINFLGSFLSFQRCMKVNIWGLNTIGTSL